MWKVNLVIAGLIVGSVLHMLVALMAALHFMWWTAALAAMTACVGVWFVDKLEEEFYR